MNRALAMKEAAAMGNDQILPPVQDIARNVGLYIAITLRALGIVAVGYVALWLLVLVVGGP